METPLNFRLCEAAWNGDPKQVKELAILGADVDCFDGKMGDTPLHLAIEQCDREVVQVLLECGADPNKRTRSGFWTPLIHAVESVSDAAIQRNRSPDNSIISLLLEHSAEVNQRSTRGISALDYATKYGNEGAIALLQGAGASA